MNILSFVAFALVMCVLVVTVRQLKPEMSLLLVIACGVVLTFFLIGYLSPLLSEIAAIASQGGIDSGFVSVALKSLGICIAVQTASDVCRDAGQTALAEKIELGGRLALLIVALPLFRQLLDLALEIIGT